MNSDDDIDCPNCGGTLTVTADQMINDDTVTCPHCGNDFEFDGSALRNWIDDLIPKEIIIKL